MSPTPYPTKSEHILQPSVIRRQQHGASGENTTPSLFSPPNRHSRNSSSQGGYLSDDSDRPRTANAPALSLKRSVAALRDMYEAQAEKSRPSTAVTSPVMRPTSAASNRLRSMSSSESLSGGSMWEALQISSIDDLAMLPPPLRTTSGTVRNVTSDLEGRRQQLHTSSPNITKLGSSSTSRFSIYEEISHPQYDHVPLSSSVATFSSSDPSTSLTSSSSPNVVRLGRSSSVSEIPEEDESSSPNVVRLGSSSSAGKTSPPGESAELASSPQTIRHHKRKRSEPQEKMLSFAARSGALNPFSSSPPYEASVGSGSAISTDLGFVLPSSPPRISVDVVSQAGSVNTIDFLADQLDIAIPESSAMEQSHGKLQAVMTSSPAPPVQYPVVRAPATASWTSLSVPKRPPRVAALDSAKWTSRLSTVPSETSGRRSNRNSMRTSTTDDDYSLSDGDSDIAPARAYMANHDEAIHSRSRMVSATESDHHEAEAADFVSALPSAECRLSSPPTTSYHGVDTNSSTSRLNSFRNSVDTRLNSMKSFRNNSMRNSQRPSSSSSTNTFQLPSWARRYYSGIYRDSFQEMYASATDLPSQTYSGNYGPAPPAPLMTRPDTSNTTKTRPSTAVSRKASSIAASVRSIVFPKPRPRLNARNSHLAPGVGPLVSNPVRAPAARVRLVSIPLDPADPRTHWTSAQEELAAFEQMMQNGLPQKNRIGRGRPTSWSRSPHLHRDDRLMHRHSRWEAPSLDEKHEPLLSRRNAQIMCFVLGFVTIVPWFVGSVLPLPERPQSRDLEKRISADIKGRMRRDAAVVDELRWENAAWWRTVNRWMCVVGGVFIVLVVVLGVVGSRDW